VLLPLYSPWIYTEPDKIAGGFAPIFSGHSFLGRVEW
jgi:hypothetical protein